MLGKAKDKVGEGCALIYKSEVHHKLGDHKMASSTATDAADLLEEEDKARYALALSRAAISSLASKDTSATGFQLADKALKAFNEAKETKEIVPLKLEMAQVAFQDQQYVEAEDLAEDAEKVAKQAKILALEARAAQLLSTIRLTIAVEDAKAKDADPDTMLATESVRNALFLYRKLGDRHGEALAMGKLAQVRYESRALDMAKMAAEEAQAMFRELGDSQQEAPKCF